MKKIFWTVAIAFLASSAITSAQEFPAPLGLIQENVEDDQYPGSTTRIFGWSGEPIHEQPSRPNDGEIDETSKTYWLGQPFASPQNLTTGSDRTVVTCRDDEADVIIISVLLDGRPEIVEQFVGEGGIIDWSAVAGTNAAQHEHWPNAFGIVEIYNFNQAQDMVIVNGHTVARGGTQPAGDNGVGIDQVVTIETDADGNETEVVTPLRTDQYGALPGGAIQRIKSQQGAGGGAHDEDTLGFICWPDREEVPANSSVQLRGTNQGVVQTFGEFLALTTWYNDIHESLKEETADADYVNFLLLLQSWGLNPDDFTEDQLAFLFDWLG